MSINNTNKSKKSTAGFEAFRASLLELTLQVPASSKKSIVPAVSPPPSKTLLIHKEVTLYYTDITASSDKVYNLKLVIVTNGGYSVLYSHGKRNGKMQSGEVIRNVSLQDATKSYMKTLALKTSNGYTTNVSGVPFS